MGRKNDRRHEKTSTSLLDLRGGFDENCVQPLEFIGLPGCSTPVIFLRLTKITRIFDTLGPDAVTYPYVCVCVGVYGRTGDRVLGEESKRDPDVHGTFSLVGLLRPRSERTREGGRVRNFSQMRKWDP